MIRLAPRMLLLLLATAVPLHAADKLDCPDLAEKGQALRDEKKLKAAREMFLRCSVPQCPKAVRADCSGLFLPQVEAATPTVIFRAVDAQGNDLTQVRVRVDGELVAERLEGVALSMDPGLRLFAFEGAGLTVERKILVVEGEKNRVLNIELKRSEAPPPASTSAPAATGPAPSTPLPPPAEASIGPWVVLGVGALSLGVFGAFQLWARSQKSTLESGCGQTRTCSDDELSPVRTKFLISGVGLGLGLAGLAVGGGWLLFRSPPAASALRLQPTYGGAALSFEHIFLCKVCAAEGHLVGSPR